ncbi:hypothetical protein [Kitasatospora purpeofusca]|uniref:hypothetical protein n=1 Tax=Kitasatospora purpeofusca TaxID=67352 RepID=UPI00386FFCBA|nr:hypothetical protein OIP63_00290 [Kitasatospora purpeofusca]
MSGKVWVKAALVAVAGVAVVVGVMLVLLIAAWWSLGSEDYYSKPAPEVVRHTPQQFQELSERTVQDALGSLGLVLSDRGCTVDRYEQRSDGTPSRLATFDRRFTARTRIGASHRQELKDRVDAAWRLRGYRQEPPVWTPSNPAEDPDLLSAETSEGIGVWVALSPETDGTVTLTMSVSGTDVAYAPEYARPLSPLRPDTEDAYWSH